MTAPHPNQRGWRRRTPVPRPCAAFARLRVPGGGLGSQPTTPSPRHPWRRAWRNGRSPGVRRGRKRGDECASGGAVVV